MSALLAAFLNNPRLPCGVIGNVGGSVTLLHSLPTAPVSPWSHGIIDQPNKKPAAKLAPNALGALMIAAGTLFVALQGAGIKLLDGSLGWEQIVFLRSLILAAFLLPIVIRKHAVATRRPMMHAARGLLGIAAMSCMVYALLEAPLADVTAISFSRALFVVILAIVILHETVGWRRWSAVVIGFAGIVLMLRPGEDGVSVALLFAVAGAFLGAWVVMILKSLSQTEAPETIVFWFGVSGVVLMAVPAALNWQWPTLWQWVIVVGLSAAGSLAQYFLVRGWSLGEASALAPVGYAQLVWATILGIVLFSEIPDAWTIGGAVIIVASTLYIAIRENRRKAARPAVADV